MYEFVKQAIITSLEKHDNERKLLNPILFFFKIFMLFNLSLIFIFTLFFAFLMCFQDLV